MKRRQVFQAAAAGALVALLPESENIGIGVIDGEQGGNGDGYILVSSYIPVESGDMTAGFEIDPPKVFEDGGVCRIGIRMRSPLDQRFIEHAKEVASKKHPGFIIALEQPVRVQYFCHDGTQWGVGRKAPSEETTSLFYEEDGVHTINDYFPEEERNIPLITMIAHHRLYESEHRAGIKWPARGPHNEDNLSYIRTTFMLKPA